MSDPSQQYGNNGSASYGGGGYGGGASYSYGGGAGAGGVVGGASGGGGGGASAYPSYGGGGGGGAAAAPAEGGGLRRRTAAQTGDSHSNNNNGNGNKYHKPNRAVVESLDFMFPKVDKEFTVQTKSGGVTSLVAYGLIALLCLAELVTWMGQNRTELTQTSVDTSLGKKMRVNMNITFPALACEDLHLDAIDVAGDSQIDVEDTLKKRKLHMDGKIFSKEEIDVETNYHRDQQASKEQLLKDKLPADYCGPCYGAQAEDNQCCQTCDSVLMAYTTKRWKTELLKYTAEQCVREGRDKAEPRKMIKGQGCNLSGFMTVNRVSGNFHIAMGEGIERDGRHIHTYMPEDAPNYNASHIIHQLSFGPEDGKEPLKGAVKIVTEDTGITGLFQYFIKVVPTTYLGDALPKIADSLPSLDKDTEAGKGKENTMETNRYFFTERFMPLMTELLEDHHHEEDDPRRAAVHAGPGGGHDNHAHHMKQNSVLPGVFFIYEIYPFAVEIRKNSVPFTHLLIRLMATIGGVFTVARWADSWLYERGTKKSSR